MKSNQDFAERKRNLEALMRLAEVFEPENAPPTLADLIHESRIHKSPSKTASNFKKYTQLEFSALQDMSKAEMIADLTRRNAVEFCRRKSQPKSRKKKEVSVILRTSGAGGEWFHLRIQGFGAFTTKNRVDIRDAKSKQAEDPARWWISSSYAEVLFVDICSAIAFLILHGQPACQSEPEKHAAGYHFRRAFVQAMETWGFNGENMLDELIETELGPTRFSKFCERHFTWSEEIESLAERYDREHPVVDEGFDAWEESLKAAERQGVNWKPGEPFDWLQEESGRYFRTLYALRARFVARYPKLAREIGTRYSTEWQFRHLYEPLK